MMIVRILQILAFFFAPVFAREALHAVPRPDDVLTNQESPSISPTMLDLVLPFDGQEYESNDVSLLVHPTAKFELGNAENKNKKSKICTKLVLDYACSLEVRLKDDLSRLDALTKSHPYVGCSNAFSANGSNNINGGLKPPAGCWVLRVDLVRARQDGSKDTVESHYSRFLVKKIDEHIDKLYSSVPHLFTQRGGVAKVLRRALDHKGLGLTLQVSAGETSSMELLSAVKATKTSTSRTNVDDEDDKIHTFVSLYGLSEAWGRETAGAYTLNGTFPQQLHRKLESTNIHVSPGDLQETLPRFLKGQARAAPIGLLLVDLYAESSTSFVLDELACRLSAGSIILSGSYFNYPNWTATRGERTAWKSAVEKWGINFEYLGYFSSLMMIKIHGRPSMCPGNSGGYNVTASNDVMVHPGLAKWSDAKILSARQSVSEDLPAAVQELEEVLAVDPTNVAAMRLLAITLEDIYRISDRFDYARGALIRQHRMPPPNTDAVGLLRSLEKFPHEVLFDRKVRLHRLQHDLEQLKYLAALKRLPGQLAKKAITAYERVMKQFSGAAMDRLITLTWEQWQTIGPYFNRALHLPVVSRVRGGALNPMVNFTKVQQLYHSGEHRVAVVDNLLSETALKELLKYYREATIFYDSGVGHASYVGSYMVDGVGNPILAQVVEELAEKLRPIICDRPLVQAWVYKYDSSIPRGINIHADQAAINLNLWLTENESTDPNGGGLVVFTEKPPEDWGFEIYNTEPTPPEVLSLLAKSNYRNITVPYKQNRMLLFDSKLFHVSDVTGWKEGYEKRRINLTLLFGRVNTVCPSAFH